MRSHVGWSALVVTVASMATALSCGGGSSNGDASTAAASGDAADACGAAGDAGTTLRGGAVTSCRPGRLTAAEATTLYSKYAYEVQPGLNPGVLFDARELEVEGLWDDLGAQLFHVDERSANGDPWRECTILIHACQVLVPAGECSVVGSLPLSSGLVANGAFYFSWGFGSGVYRSQIGKLTREGDTFTKVVSPVYTNASLGPPPVGVRKLGAQIGVFRARVYRFNEWLSDEKLGRLDDRCESLVVVDDSGQPISQRLP
jgi:hypothetical protein